MVSGTRALLLCCWVKLRGRAGDDENVSLTMSFPVMSHYGKVRTFYDSNENVSFFMSPTKMSLFLFVIRHSSFKIKWVFQLIISSFVIRHSRSKKSFSLSFRHSSFVIQLLIWYKSFSSWFRHSSFAIWNKGILFFFFLFFSSFVIRHSTFDMI